MYKASDLKKGLKIELDGEPHIIVGFDFSKPTMTWGSPSSSILRPFLRSLALYILYRLHQFVAGHAL